MFRFVSSVTVLVFTIAISFSAPAQTARPDSFFSRYENRLAETQNAQPNWATPLITTAPRLEQGFRTDFIRESLPGGATSWNFGGAKGFQFVPLHRMELRFSPPPFFTHSDPKTEDGFGDVSMRAKYRIYGSPETRRDAIVTALLAASLPTGKSRNGSCCAVLTPTLEAGKGWGRLDAILSVGGSLPVTGARSIGRQASFNEALQYHSTRLLWLEVELNSTLYRGGKNDGKEQTFATPGIVVSRIPLRRYAGSRREQRALTLAAGEQIALSRFNTYNHSLIFSSRFRF